MKRSNALPLAATVFGLALAQPVGGRQISKEELLLLTPEWTGERIR